MPKNFYPSNELYQDANTDEKYHAALLKWLNKYAVKDGFEAIEITSTDWDNGGDFQIGEMTWDHENASMIIKFKYKHVNGQVHAGVTTVDIDDFTFAGFLLQLLDATND